MDEELIKENIKKYTWYTPVNFGNDIVATGNFKVRTYLNSIHFGMGKWKYIIERNLPDLQGKRVIDIGCNNGLACIQMAKMGAREVIGVDSDKTWPNWKNQAQFVKAALEWRSHTKYPVTFIDADMAKIPDLTLGKFDVATALCCIYYLDDEKIYSLLNHFRENVDFVLIQCNTRKKDQIPEVHQRALSKYIVKVLKNVGYPYIKVDKPLFYERPVVIGSKYAPEVSRSLSKIDRIRCWVRRKV